MTLTASARIRRLAFEFRRFADECEKGEAPDIGAGELLEDGRSCSIGHCLTRAGVSPVIFMGLSNPDPIFISLAGDEIPHEVVRRRIAVTDANDGEGAAVVGPLRALANAFDAWADGTL